MGIILWNGWAIWGIRVMVHTREVPAVSTLPYAPAVHAVHADVPVVRPLYMPTVHAVHTRDVPAESTLPYAPAAHPVHADVPEVSALYAPAAHTVHTVDVPAVSTSL